MIPEDSSKGLAEEGKEQAEALDAENPEQPEESQGAGEQGAESLSAEGLDISKLPTEAQKIVKGFQAKFTKKTQAIAESKKSLEAKERQIDSLREKYEQRLFELTQPKGKEEPVVDTAQMTIEQRDAWEKLNRHFDKKLEQVRNEERQAFEKRLGAIQGQVGDMAWRTFVRDNPGASKYRTRMSELYQEKGGVNCPLTLDELLTLAQKDDLKRLGVEEYKRNVQTKKTNMTTKPSSTAGGEAEIPFEKDAGHNPARRKRNFFLAAERASDDIASGRVKAK